MSGPDSRYGETGDSHGFFKFILRFFLKLMWSVGGKHDADDGMPRVFGKDIAPHLSSVAAGDFLLIGNNGSLSHIAVYVGEGAIVHSMATEKTMRGGLGSFWDALRRPLWWTFGITEKTGVIEEDLPAFLDRYERDTWVACRRDGLEPAQVDAGIAHIRTLVGKAYDYDFSADDDEYYCTEIVVEFLRGALPPAAQPKLATRHVQVPLLLNAHVIEPIAVLQEPTVVPIIANHAAAVNFADLLEGGEIV